ncbi:MAG: S9 family peptidase [Mangrovibacterium sp.]
MKSFYPLLFLCLLFAAGRELNAQTAHDSLCRVFSETSHMLTAPVMTDDGRWLTFRKRSWEPVWKKSDLNKDTVVLFDLRDPGKAKIAGYRENVWTLAFAGNTHLLLSYGLKTELLDLNEQTSCYFTGVQRLQVLKNKNQFVLHYNKEENDRLELRSTDGTLLNAMDHVNRFYAAENGDVFAVAGNKEHVSDLFLVRDRTQEKVYSSDHKILSLDIDSARQGIMIHEQGPGGDSEEILYLELKTKNLFPLKEVLSVAFQRGFAEVISEGSSYFLRLWIHRPKNDTSLVDIWQGSDNRLEEKFRTPARELCYIWEPQKRSVQRIGTDLLTKSACIGNGRYFLSLDPYLLQDYTREKPLLKLYRYDRKEDTYAVIDTIPSWLFTSPAGQYVLYFKNGTWHIYYNSSGTRDTIGDGKLKTPYFTPDGKQILFDGEGGLWRYDPEKKDLVLWNSFKGYQTTILNGTSRTSLPGFNFFEKTVSPDKPLVIKLVDPSENKSTYILWKDGQYKTVVPPTTKHIPSFSYNPSFTCFSWLEEDYNLPPRLVYKEMGKKETVLYQSNRLDTAILSLKQEIISYTNSDSIPLKGILYYPLGYDPSQKYPMVVHIYQKQRQLANQYPYPSYYEGLGFNIRLFLENGYFVYLPDILIQGEEGPGMEALDCVNALNALARNPLIDLKKAGLIGHSLGGYETDYIAARSARFAAYVSGSGHSDIIWASHAFNYNFHFPDHVRIEANAYKLGKPFAADKGLYFKNNPLYHAEKVNAPVLLWAGLEDQNVTSDHTMAFYNALRRNNKQVVALFYKGEGHGLLQKPAQFDLTSRILDWFGYFLKGEETETGWIEEGTGKDK